MFHIHKCIYVSEHLIENVMYHHVVNLECIILVVNIDPIHSVLT